MKTKHISKILDCSNFADLSAKDLAIIRDHAAVCQMCRQALQAARISSALLKIESVADAPAPMPFFQAKVLNVWRERQILQKPPAGFRRWWQASAAMVFIMLLLIGALISVSFLTTDSNSIVKQTERFDYNLYSADTVILNQKMPKELTDEQALEVLEDAKSNQDKK